VAQAMRIRTALMEKGLPLYADSSTNQLFPILTDDQLEALEEMASHDTLTKLLNADYAGRQICRRLEEEPDGRYMLMLIDIDDIKTANDSRGRLFGDQVLVHAAEVLRQNKGDNDIVARVSGDEFLFFTRCDSDEETRADRLISALEGEYQGFKVSACVGTAAGEGKKTDYDRLFQEADKALMEAKKGGPGQHRTSRIC